MICYKMRKAKVLKQDKCHTLRDAERIYEDNANRSFVHSSYEKRKQEALSCFLFSNTDFPNYLNGRYQFFSSRRLTTGFL